MDMREQLKLLLLSTHFLLLPHMTLLFLIHLQALKRPFLRQDSIDYAKKTLTGKQIDEILIEVDEGIDGQCGQVSCQGNSPRFLEVGRTKTNIQHIFEEVRMLC